MVIYSLKDSFLLEQEDGMAGFLGLQINRDTEDGLVTLTQEGLTDMILEAMNLQDENPNYTPADKVPLTKDLDREPCCEGWKYRSVVGMLLYLGGSTRTDISYAVHQCARFSHKPMRFHEVALKQIGTYLKGTNDKRMIMKPNKKKLSLDLFADADFAGLFAAKDRDDPISVKSRIGILLNFGEVPIYWS